MRVELRPEFRAAFPEGIFGVLIARDCANRPDSTRLGPAQRAVEGRLRQRFPGDAIDVDPVAVAYRGYFRRFGNRYPVVHQAKAILTGRPIESPSALVEAMFTAEVDSLVLTSGHDLDALAEPLQVDVARDGDLYTKISGKEERLRPGDMIVRDAQGVIASVLHGPDSRTRLRAASTAALFGAWCPVGLAADVAERHLNALAALLRLEWPEAIIDAPRIYRSGGT